MAIDVREQVSEYVRAGMLDASTVLSERDLAKQFNTTRGHTRQVLLSLEGEGVLRRLPRRGYTYINYDNTDRYSVLYVRYHIEREAWRKAVRRANQRDLQAVREIHERMERHCAEKNWEAFSRDDKEFHAALVRASHDNMLIHIFSYLSSTLFVLHESYEYRSGMDAAFERTQANHRAIVDRFLARDWPALKEALHEHIGKSLTENDPE